MESYPLLLTPSTDFSAVVVVLLHLTGSVAHLSLCLQLPQKTDRIVFCAPTESQMTVYRRALDTPVMHLLRTKDEMCTFPSTLY